MHASVAPFVLFGLVLSAAFGAGRADRADRADWPTRIDSRGSRPVAAAADTGARSSDVLSLLPDGETKRQFIIDCTNCHQIDQRHAFPNGVPRSRAQWAEDVSRMMRMAGATTGFPIISAGRDPDVTAEYLATHFTAAAYARLRASDVRDASGANSASSASGATTARARPNVRASAQVTEYLLPNAGDLPHDVAVDSSGHVLVTGMFSHVMYTLDTGARRFDALPIPVANANPRAVEIAKNGDWWVLLGAPNTLSRYVPARGAWNSFPIGMYGHSVALDGAGRAWYNGHFTRDPSIIGHVDSTGARKEFAVPRHPTMSAEPGGPIPYELRVAPDGRVWMSELQGNRIISLDPASGAFTVHTLPTSVSAPRRFDIDRSGVLWIPAYAANLLVRFDPATQRFTEIPLPRRDAVPYVARVDRRGQLWIGTNASGEVYRYDPAGDRFTTYELPSRGAVIRHIVLDPRNDDVWLAYGASPGIAARVARLRP